MSDNSESEVDLKQKVSDLLDELVDLEGVVADALHKQEIAEVRLEAMVQGQMQIDARLQADRQFTLALADRLMGREKEKPSILAGIAQELLANLPAIKDLFSALADEDEVEPDTADSRAPLPRGQAPGLDWEDGSPLAAGEYARTDLRAAAACPDDLDPEESNAIIAGSRKDFWDVFAKRNEPAEGGIFGLRWGWAIYWAGWDKVMMFVILPEDQRRSIIKKMKDSAASVADKLTALGYATTVGSADEQGLLTLPDLL